MSDYLIRLAAKSLNLSKVVLPRLASLYEPLSMNIGDMFDTEWLESQSLNESLAEGSTISNAYSEKPLKNSVDSAPAKLEEELPDGPGQASSRPLSVRQSLASSPASDNIIEKEDNKSHALQSASAIGFEEWLDAGAKKAFSNESSGDNESSEEMPLAADKKATHNPKTAQARSKPEENKYAGLWEQATKPHVTESTLKPSIAIQSPLRKESHEKTPIKLSDEEPPKTIEVRSGERQSIKPSTFNPSGEIPSYEDRIDEKRLFETENESNSAKIQKPIATEENRQNKQHSLHSQPILPHAVDIQSSGRSIVKEDANIKMPFSSADHGAYSPEISGISDEVESSDRSMTGKDKETYTKSSKETQYLDKGISRSEVAASELSSVQAGSKDSAREKLTLVTYSPEISAELSEVESRNRSAIDRGKEVHIKPALAIQGSKNYNEQQTNPIHLPIVASPKETQSIDDDTVAFKPSQDSAELLSISQPLAGSLVSDSIDDTDTHALPSDKANSHKEHLNAGAVKAFKNDSLEKVPFASDKEASYNSKTILAKSKSEQTEYARSQEHITEPHVAEPSLKPSIVIQPPLRKVSSEKTLMGLGSEEPSKTSEVRSRKREHQNIKSSTFSPSSENSSYEILSDEDKIAEKMLSETGKEYNSARLQESISTEGDRQNIICNGEKVYTERALATQGSVDHEWQKHPASLPTIKPSSPIITSSREAQPINENMAVSGTRRTSSRPPLASQPLPGSSMSDDINDNIVVDRADNEIRALSHTLQPASINSHKGLLDASAMKAFRDDSSEKMPSTLDEENPYTLRVVQAKSRLEKTEYTMSQKQTTEPHIAEPSLKPSIAAQPPFGNVSPEKTSIQLKGKKPSKTIEVRSREQEQQSIKSSNPSGKNPSDETPSNKDQIAEKRFFGTELESSYVRIQRPIATEEDWQNMQYSLRPPLVSPHIADIPPSKRSVIKEGTNIKSPFSSADLEDSIEQMLGLRNNGPNILTELKEVKSPEQSVIKKYEKIYPQSARMQQKPDENPERQAFAVAPLTSPPSEDAQFIKRSISKGGKTTRFGNISAPMLSEDSIKREYRWVSDLPADIHKVQQRNRSVSEMENDDIAAMSSEPEEINDSKVERTSLLPLRSKTSKVHEVGINTLRDERDTRAEGIPKRMNIVIGEQYIPVLSSQISSSQAEVHEDRSQTRTNNVLKDVQSPFAPHMDEIKSQSAQEISGKTLPLMGSHSPLTFQPSIERASLEPSPTETSLFRDVMQREQGHIDPSINKKPSNIRVTIGRVDVHAPPVERIIPMELPSASAKKLSLDDYLKMRNEGRL